MSISLPKPNIEPAPDEALDEKRLREALKDIQRALEVIRQLTPLGSQDLANGAVSREKLAKREVVGAVNAEGTILNGSGFTCEKTATGKYTIKLSTALSSAGAIFIQLNGSFTQVHKSTGPSTSEWKIEINGFNFAVPKLEAASEAFSFQILEI